jgi:hypothetical protein
MTPVTYYRSRPDTWTVPRWKLDASERRRIFGPIQPMDEHQSILARLLGLH